MGHTIPKQSALAREEWDFSTIDPSFADTCLRYEFAREIEEPMRYFQSLSSRIGNMYELTSYNFHSTIKQSSTPEVLHRMEGLFVRSGLVGQDRAALHLPELFRYLYFLHQDGIFRAYPDDLEVTPWQLLPPNWSFILQIAFKVLNAGFRSVSQETIARGIERDPTIMEWMSKPGPRQLFTTIIDWSQSDTAILNDFEEWLGLFRPPSLPSKSLTGRQSSIDNLNALAAMRLRHHYSADDAFDITQKALGRPLYFDSWAWARASNRATELFQAMFPGAGNAKSSKRIPNLRGRPPKKTKSTAPRKIHLK